VFAALAPPLYLGAGPGDSRTCTAAARLSRSRPDAGCRAMDRSPAAVSHPACPTPRTCEAEPTTAIETRARPLGRMLSRGDVLRSNSPTRARERGLDLAGAHDILGDAADRFAGRALVYTHGAASWATQVADSRRGLSLAFSPGIRRHGRKRSGRGSVAKHVVARSPLTGAMPLIERADGIGQRRCPAIEPRTRGCPRYLSTLHSALNPRPRVYGLTRPLAGHACATMQRPRNGRRASLLAVSLPRDMLAAISPLSALWRLEHAQHRTRLCVIRADRCRRDRRRPLQSRCRRKCLNLRSSWDAGTVSQLVLISH